MSIFINYEPTSYEILLPLNMHTFTIRALKPNCFQQQQQQQTKHRPANELKEQKKKSNAATVNAYMFYIRHYVSEHSVIVAILVSLALSFALKIQSI